MRKKKEKLLCLAAGMMLALSACGAGTQVTESAEDAASSEYEEDLTYADPTYVEYATGWCGHDFDWAVKECMDADANDNIQVYQCLDGGELGKRSRMALFDALGDKMSAEQAQQCKDDGCTNPYIDKYIDYRTQYEKIVKKNKDAHSLMIAMIDLEDQDW